jgi:1-acyl-sn-glycerol-3-phosphate acyltransferase
MSSEHRSSGFLNRFVLTPGVRGFLRGLVKSGFIRSTVEGRENVPVKGPYIVAFRHISLADPLFGWGALRGVVRAVAAQGLWKIPLLGLLMWLQGHIPVIRGNRTSGAKVRQAMDATLQGGGIIMIFPEAKLMPRDRMRRLKRGVADTSFANAVEVVPCGITGTDVFWPRGWFVPRRWRARVTLRFGEPLNPANYTQDEAGKQAMLLDLLEDIARLSGLPAEYPIVD